MKTSMLTMAIKPFLPQLKESAGKMIDEAVNDYLNSIQLDDKEAYPALLVCKNKQDQVFILTVCMDSTDTITRCLRRVLAKDFVNSMLDNLNKA